MKPNKIFHVSEEGDIKTFLPRPSPSPIEKVTGDVVFGISDTLLHNYLFPRNCPRVTYYAKHDTSQSDREAFFHSSAEFVVAIEARWLPIVQQTTIYCYELPAETFSILDECAGYYVSSEQVNPISVLRIENPIDALLSKNNVELLVLPTLWTLADKVSKSTLNFSLIRMRYAKRGKDEFSV
jgi:hypothetical protein